LEEENILSSKVFKAEELKEILIGCRKLEIINSLISSRSFEF